MGRLHPNDFPTLWPLGSKRANHLVDSDELLGTANSPDGIFQDMRPEKGIT